MTNLDTSSPDTSNPEVRRDILKGLPRDLYDLAAKQAKYYGSLAGNRIEFNARRWKSFYENAPGSLKLALGLVAGAGIMYLAAVAPLKKQVEHQEYCRGVAEWENSLLREEKLGMRNALEACVESFDKYDLKIPREVFDFIPE